MWLEWDLPEIELFEKVEFVVAVHKLWKNFSIVSEVIDEMLESSTVTIQKDLFLNFL
jgi:hypothetical protein